MLIRHRLLSTVALVALASGVGSGMPQIPQVPPPPPPPPPPITALQPSGPGDASRATGAISGVILDRGTGAPLAGASVLLTQRGNGQGFPARRFITDARGRFVFRDLTPSPTYNLMVSKPGFLDEYFCSPVADYATAQPISLADGQWVSTIEVRLTKLGAITGRVVDEAGEPVVGIFVRTLTEVPVAGRPQLAAGDFARTDDRGEYRIGGLRAGRYFVTVPSVQHALPREMPPAGTTGGPRAVDPTAVTVDADTRLTVGGYATPPPLDGTPRTYPTVFFPDARTVGEATPLELRNAQTQTADFRLQPVAGWRVSGRVEAESSAAGLLLRLVATGLEDLGFGSEAGTAVVDAAGRFTFVNVPAGRYTIEGRRTVMEYRTTTGGMSSITPFPVSPAFSMQSGGAGTIAGSPAGVMYSYTAAGAGGDLVGRVAVDVSGRDLSNVVLPLRRPAKLSGRIEREPSETATDQPAPPAGGLRMVVQAQPANGSASLGLLSTQAGEDGRFEIDGLLEGPYVIRVLGGGAIRSITWAGRDMTNTAFDASAAQGFSDVVVTLTSRTSSIAGSVKRSSPGASTVIAFPVEREAWTNFGFTPSRLTSVSVSSTGAYQLPVPGGDYFIVAVDAQYQRAWQDPGFLAKVAPLATRVALDWGEKKALELALTEVP